MNTAAAVSAVLSLIFSRPQQFPWLMLQSTATVLCAALLYTIAQPRHAARHVPPEPVQLELEAGPLLAAGPTSSEE